jgi:hypothetical protein
MRKELISWLQVDKLIDHLIPQFNTEFDAILMIQKGGIIPGGLLAEALGIQALYIADVEFPKEFELERQRSDPRFLSWPATRSFPENEKIAGRKILIVGSAWGTGRCYSAVRNRVNGANGQPFTCALHYCPNKNLFPEEKPDFFAAVTDAWIIYPWESPKGKSLVIS